MRPLGILELGLEGINIGFFSSESENLRGFFNLNFILILIS